VRDLLRRVKAVLLIQVIPPMSDGFNRKLKAARRWSLWAILVLFGLGIVSWSVFNWVAGRQLDRALADLQAAGYPIRLSDCAPPPVLAEENAAPFFSAAFALISKPSHGGEQKAFEKVTKMGLGGLSSDQEATIRTWLERNRNAIELLARARTKPRCRFDRKYEGYETRFPELEGISWFLGVLSVRAQIEAKDGRLKEARESVSDILRLSNSIADEPSILCQMYRLGAIGTALLTVNRCVNEKTDADALRQWLAILPRESDLDGCMERPLRAELATLAESLPLPSYLLLELEGRRRDEDLGSIILTRLSYPVQRRDGAHCLQLLRRAAELSRKSYTDGQAEWQTFQEEASGGSAVLNHVTGWVLPGMSGIAKVQVSNQANIAVTRAGLEWELEYSTTGRYPDKVSVLNPITGQPLIYDTFSGRLSRASSPYQPNSAEHDHDWLLRRRQ
jgi:hypothetical protein